MASILHELQIKYKGTTVTKTGNEERTVVVYQGSRELCEQALNDKSLVQNDELGYIDSMKLTQDEGPHWNLEVTYVVEYTNAALIVGGGTNPTQQQPVQRSRIKKGSSKNVSSSELNVRMMSAPIETAYYYRKYWNYNMYCTWSINELDEKGIVNPNYYNEDYQHWMNVYVYYNGNDGWPYTAENVIPRGLPIWKAWCGDIPMAQVAEYPGGNADPKQCPYIAWGKSLGDLPSLPSNQYWFLIADMTKPGVESWEKPVYELTESSKHASKNDAAWAISSKSGRIAYPSSGDFGINDRIGGNWLCEGGSVREEGKYWVARCTYLHSGGRKGWDQDLY